MDTVRVIAIVVVQVVVVQVVQVLGLVTAGSLSAAHGLPALVGGRAGLSVGLGERFGLLLLDRSGTEVLSYRRHVKRTCQAQGPGERAARVSSHHTI